MIDCHRLNVRKKSVKETLCSFYKNRNQNVLPKINSHLHYKACINYYQGKWGTDIENGCQ